MLAPNKALSTLPFALITVAGAVVTWFASLLMQRIGGAGVHTGRTGRRGGRRFIGMGRVSCRFLGVLRRHRARRRIPGLCPVLPAGGGGRGRARRQEPRDLGGDGGRRHRRDCRPALAAWSRDLSRRYLRRRVFDGGPAGVAVGRCCGSAIATPKRLPPQARPRPACPRGRCAKWPASRCSSPRLPTTWWVGFDDVHHDRRALAAVACSHGIGDGANIMHGTWSACTRGFSPAR